MKEEEMKAMVKAMAINMETRIPRVEGLPGTTNSGTILGMMDMEGIPASGRRKD
jgi:hypothetical protein